jgi:hypothetical protein
MFQKHKLLGVFAWDCARPPSDRNWYTMHRPIDANRVEQTILTGPGRPYVTVFNSASETAENSITVSGTRNKQAVSGVWQMDGRRMLELEATTNGKTEIAEGKRLRDGQAVSWARKCSP